MNYLTIATTLSFIAAMVWFIIVYRLDRHEKEPIWLLIKIFLLSFLLSNVAGVLNYLTSKFFGETGSLIFVGFIEEGIKFLAVWWIAFKDKAFDEPIDGVVYASASALGFAFAENIEYNLMMLYYYKDNAGGMLFTRAFLPFLHVLFSSLWGFGLGYYKKYIWSKKQLLSIWILAAILHSTYDLAVGKVAYFIVATFTLLGIYFIFKMKHLNRISPKNNRHLINCPYCNKKIAENSLYCKYCGKQIILLSTTELFCKNCKAQVDDSWKFCMNCGEKL